MDTTMTGMRTRSSTAAFAIIAGVFCLPLLLPAFLNSWLWIAGLVILAISMFARMKNVIPAIGFALLAADRIKFIIDISPALSYGTFSYEALKPIFVLTILQALMYLLAAVICFASLTNLVPMQRAAFRKLWFLPAILAAVVGISDIIRTVCLYGDKILAYGVVEYLTSSGVSRDLLLYAFTTSILLFSLLWAANPDGIPSKSTSKAYCNMALHILLLLFSSGIWYWVWNYRMTRDTNAVRDEAERNPVTKLLLCMFIPFYKIYWTYKTAQRIDKMAWERNIPSSTASLCLIMEFFLPIIPPIVMQDKMNAIATVRGPQPAFYQRPAAQPQAAEAWRSPQNQPYAAQAQRYQQAQPQAAQAQRYPQAQPQPAQAQRYPQAQPQAAQAQRYPQAQPQPAQAQRYQQAQPQAAQAQRYPQAQPQAAQAQRYPQAQPQPAQAQRYPQAQPQAAQAQRYPQAQPQPAQAQQYPQAQPQPAQAQRYPQAQPQAAQAPRYPQAQPQAAQAQRYPQAQPQPAQAPRYPQAQPQPAEARRYPQRQPQATEQDISEKLRTYKALLDVGAISQKEFEEKKRQLLGL